MQKVINYLRGSVQLELTGAFPERFLNICAAENVPFWRVEQPDPHTLRVTLAVQDRKLAEQLASRSMCQVREVGRRGMPAFLTRFRKRYALLAGLALSILAACILSNFVLIIDVTGNERVSRGEILSELDRLGFGIGSYGPAVDERDLVNRALLDLEDLGFLTINIKGIRAEVVVREAPVKPEIVDKNKRADVVAVRDGVILEVGAKAGKEMVKEGDAVLKGEVLISGLVTYEDGTGEEFSSREVRADGEVWAITERTERRSIPLKTWGKGASQGSQTRYALRVLGHRIKFYRNSSISYDNYDKISREYQLTLPGGLELPVSWIKTEITSYESASTTLTRESAERYLKERLQEQLKAEVADGTVLSQSWETEEKDGVLTVTVKASCNEQIGRTVELEDSEPGESNGR